MRYSELAGTVVFLSKWANFREKPNMSMGWESGFTISRGVDRTKTKSRVRAGFILEAQARQFWWIVYHFSYRIRFLTKTWFDDILLPSERKIGNGIQWKEDFYINCMQECMYVVGLVCCMFVYISTVLYMSFDMFLLAVESRDLYQADKSLIKVSTFPKWSHFY